MGIKQLFQELGPGERVALTRIAAQKLEKTGIPFRLAIDYSIWAFQMESSAGGPNPVLRTLFFRLVRLMSLNIVPIFVFDGPKRPAFKRNKKTHTGPGRNDQLAKELIELFGFPTHNAPGEAEAECAFLQREGIVDAVLTEDSDALMFGCGVTFRNWSSGKSSGPVTHINVYDLETIKKDSGLTPAGMVLVALMSGADYIPEGIARCGIKTALEAARGGWGDRLATIDPDDEAAILEWREDLLWELKRNENKTFRRKHPSVHFKDEFPQREAWGFYKNPLVSCRTEADVERLKDSIYWNGGPDIQHLREYTRQNFRWGGKNGAEKFIRVMAPAMLAWRLRRDSPEDLIELINGIHGRRDHASTDNVFELRLSAVPGQIVPIDLASEEFDADGEVINMESLNEIMEIEEEDEAEAIKKAKNWEPFALDRYWVPEILVRYRLSGVVDEWDEAREAKERKKAEAALKRKGRKKGADMEKEKAFMQRYLTVTKSASALERTKAKESAPPYSEEVPPSSQDYYSLSQKAFVGKPSKSVAARTQGLRTSSQGTIVGKASKAIPASQATNTVSRKTGQHATSKEPPDTQPVGNTNQWTAAKRNPLTVGISPPERCRYSELGVYGSAANKTTTSTAKNVYDEGTRSTPGEPSGGFHTAPELQRQSSSELPPLSDTTDAELDTGSHPPVTSDYFYDAYDPYEDYDEYYGPSTLAYDPEVEEVSLPKPASASPEKLRSTSCQESSFYGSDSVFEAIENVDGPEEMPPPSTPVKSPEESHKRNSNRRTSVTYDRRSARMIRRRSESPIAGGFEDEYWPVNSTQNIYRVDSNVPEEAQKKPELTSIYLCSDDEETDSVPEKTVNGLLDLNPSTNITPSQSPSRPCSSIPPYATAASQASSSERNSISSRATSPTPSRQLERETRTNDTSDHGSDHDEGSELRKTPMPSLFSNPNDPRLSFITMTRGQHSASSRKRLYRGGLEEPATPTPAFRTRKEQAKAPNTSADLASRQRRSMISSSSGSQKSLDTSTDPVFRQRRSMISSSSGAVRASEKNADTVKDIGKSVETLEDCIEVPDPSVSRPPKEAAQKAQKSTTSNRITSYFQATKSVTIEKSAKPEKPQKADKSKKNVRLRKSLKGHWAELDDSEIQGLPDRLKRSILVGVDVVDLTGDD